MHEVMLSGAVVGIWQPWVTKLKTGMVNQRDEMSWGPDWHHERPSLPHFWNFQVNMVYALAAQSVVGGPAVQASPESSVRNAECQVLSQTYRSRICIFKKMPRLDVFQECWFIASLMRTYYMQQKALLTATMYYEVCVNHIGVSIGVCLYVCIHEYILTSTYICIHTQVYTIYSSIYCVV